MKLTFLHISDIHIHGSTDKCLKWGGQIAAETFESARESDATFIILTGDVAFSARTDEFSAAANMLKDMAGKIGKETGKLVDIFVCPGNHDCLLIPEDKPRSIVIDSVVQSSEVALDKQVVQMCTRAQENYREFRREVTSAIPVFEDELWSEYSVEIGGIALAVSSINASWMSRIPEIQGQLVFPVDDYKEHLQREADIRISLIHHPLAWYSQNSSHPLRRALRSNCDIVFSGHEHSMNGGQINELKSGKSFYFEAAALQPHGASEAPGFSIVVVDTKSDELVVCECSIRDGKVNRAEDVQRYPFGMDLRQLHGEIGITPSFDAMLRDPGGNFIHPEKDEIHLEDIFVYPELEDRELDNNDDLVSAELLFKTPSPEKRVLLLGDDKAGKTCLILRAFIDLHSIGFSPLYIKASDIGSVSEVELGKQFRRIEQQQYENPESIRRLPKAKRVALVDDIDRTPGGPKNQYRLLRYLESHFDVVVLTAAAGLELAELVDKEAAEAIGQYHFYEIRQFGAKMRHKLIQKWCLCGDVRTVQVLDRRVHEMESLIDMVIGRNLIPSRPIYLLILLQSFEQQQQGELLNSSLAYYYQYLITKSLKEAGVRPEAMNELYNYLANLAWFIKGASRKEVTEVELSKFNAEFSNSFTTVDFHSRLSLLCKAKILSRYGDSISFSYPYIQYFFLGKYISVNMADQQVKAIVVSACSELYKKENAHSVLFLIHHSNDDWVINLVVDALSSCFSGVKEMELNGDISGINSLVNSAPQLLLRNINVEKNQERSREIRDKLDRIEVDEALSESVDLSAKLGGMNRTSEILGQILKSYYGSLKRPLKHQYLQQVFDAQLRLLGFLFREIDKDPDLFAAELAKFIGVNSGDKVRLSEDASKRAAFNLLGVLSTGIILRAAQFVASEKLREDIYEVVGKKGSAAYRLIGVAASLSKPGQIPHEEIDRIAKDLDGNKFAFTTLQSLAAYHIQMFHTSDKDKQRLCESLKIDMGTSKGIDFSGRNKKLKK